MGLRPVQRSVFAGRLSQSQSKLGRLKRELPGLTVPGEDGVRFHSFPAFRTTHVDCFGKAEDHPDRILQLLPTPVFKLKGYCIVNCQNPMVSCKGGKPSVLLLLFMLCSYFTSSIPIKTSEKT